MSPHSNTTVVLVHGAFAENSSWNGVIDRLGQNGVRSVTASNPLRSVSGDAEYVADIVRSIDGPVVLVGHSYGGVVITHAATGLSNVEALVYVAAFAPDVGESTAQLSQLHPGSTLGESVEGTPLRSGEIEFTIRHDLFHAQFCADVDGPTAALMAATQRPITDRALTETLSASTPGWVGIPSWFVYGGADKNIPEAALAFFAERAGSRGPACIEDASHAIHVSRPEVVTETILRAIAR